MKVFPKCLNKSILEAVKNCLMRRPKVRMTLIFQTFWKHLHILCYQLGVSNHRRLLDLVQLKKDRTDAAVYQQLFVEISACSRPNVSIVLRNFYFYKWG